MRILLVPAAVVTALVLTACGGAKDAASSAIDRAQSAASEAGDAASSAAAAVSSAAAAASSAAAGTGDVDCSALTKDDVAKFVVYTQLLAQAGSADSIDLLRKGGVTDYTPEGMATVLDHMGVLKGHPGPGQPDPAAAIDYFAQANELVGQMVAASGAPTQAQLDAYTAAIVDVPTALKNQLAINLSLGTSCTNLG
jgi:hypothetical protein